MNLQDYKKRALSNEAFRKEYEKYDLPFEIGQMVIKARILKGLTQEKLAKLIKTKQPSIARLENGQQLPSLTFLQRIAKAFGTYLTAPKFAFLPQEPISFISEASSSFKTLSEKIQPDIQLKKAISTNIYQETSLISF